MIKGFICQKRDLIVSLEECYSCSRENKVSKCDIIPEYITFIKEKLQEEVSNEITVTKLLHCPRRTYLQTFADYYVNIEDLYFIMRGSLSHLLLENHKIEEDCIVETRFKKIYKDKEGNEIEISGKPDKIDLKTKTIYDYKTITSKLSDDYSLRWNNVRLQDKIQLNLYFWLIKDKFEIKSLKVVYLASDVIKKFDVEIITEDKKQYAEIRKAFRRAEILNEVWNKSLNEVDIEKIEKEKGWICNYCWVKNLCEKEKGGIYE